MYAQKAYNITIPREGDNKRHAKANLKFEVLRMTIEIKIAIKIEKKKSSANPAKRKTQSNSNTTTILIQK